MLPSSKRPSREEIDSIGRDNTVHTKHLMFSWKEIEGETKITCSVSKKVAKQAVERNEIKRKLRHVIVDVLPKFEAPLIGVVRVKNAEVTQKEMVEEMGEIVQKVAQ